MLTEGQIQEIRDLLNSSENPLFFYDDDPDGLCSYLLLKKYTGKGKGVVVKSSPKLPLQLLKKVEEHCPDKVFVLDKPIIPQEFVDNVKVPIVWIDHHNPAPIHGAKYFNPMMHEPKDNRPTSYWCYMVTQQNLWIAMCGIIGDWFLPEFTDNFSKIYPSLLGNAKDPGAALYNTEMGKLVRIMSFILKNNTSSINKCAAILMKIESPYEILNRETPRGKYIYTQYEKINKRYQPVLQDALKYGKKGKLLLYTYPSMMHSFTSDLSNELLYRFPDKIIIVAREKNGEMRMSLRSSKHNLPAIIKNALGGIEGYGGGHEHACGANIKVSDFKQFIENIKKQLRKTPKP